MAEPGKFTLLANSSFKVFPADAPCKFLYRFTLQSKGRCTVEADGQPFELTAGSSLDLIGSQFEVITKEIVSDTSKISGIFDFLAILPER